MLLSLGTSLSRNPGAATLRSALADCMVRVVDRLDTVKVRHPHNGYIYTYRETAPHDPSGFAFKRLLEAFPPFCAYLSVNLTLVVATFVPMTAYHVFLVC